MAHPRSPNRDKAFKMWKKSGGTLKNREIAEKLGENAAQIGKWKCLDKWEQKPLPKAGAPKGNKNAVGNRGGTGAPIGNKRAETHGAYSKIYFDTMTDEEREMMQDFNLTEEEILFGQLQDLHIKARRLKRMIAVAEAERGGLALDGVVRERTPKGEKTTTVTTSTFERIIKLDAALDRVQGRITKVTETIIKSRNERERLDMEHRKLTLLQQRMLGVIDPDLEGIEDDYSIDTDDDDYGE